MNRVYFLGGSPGSGKTTFTDAIHRNLGVEVFHTDDIFLKSNVSKNKQPYMSELRELSNPLDIWKHSPQSCLDFWIKYYEEAFGLEKEQIDILKADIMERFRRSEQTFQDAPPDNRDFLQSFAFICMLSFDVYVKKLLIEKMIDGMRKEEPGRGEKRQKNKMEGKNGAGSDI